jgi:hypothetical protein
METAMTQHFSLSSEQRDEFERRGVLCLKGLLSAGAVGRARARIVHQLERMGVSEAGGWRLPDGSRPRYPATGLKTSRVVGNKHPEILALMEEPALGATVDELLDARAFDRAIFKQPQVLFTLPNAETWTVPDGWHCDIPRLAGGGAPGVQLFACLDRVAPGGGGTLVIAGSHRLLNERRSMRMKEMKRHLLAHDYFRRLYSPQAEERAGVLHETSVIGDVAVTLVELAGEPGDAYFVDLRVLHSGAPNAAPRPRMMLTYRFARADLMRDMAEAFGWREESV